jgi:hypothetical protein
MSDIGRIREWTSASRCRGQSAGLGGDECVFKFVCEPHCQIEPHDPRCAFQRVCSTHQRLDLLRVGRVAFQFQDAGGQRCRVKTYFLAKQFEQRRVHRSDVRGRKLF